ncbi:MAG: helix-turn-helix domain-containing protein [Planctomycetes bacterium]|nr:helix-turn-helix domain-containing protein [Planctomycetota bacterium]
MSPDELRAFRVSLGMSRREFARQLFISEPTLERWERGQGGPREIHLHVLDRMREHLGAGRPTAYFRYDAGPGLPAAERLRDEERLVVETLRGMGITPREEQRSQDGLDWLVRFSLGWKEGEGDALALVCRGSDRPERPAIDFALEVRDAPLDGDRVGQELLEIFTNHCLLWKLAPRSSGPWAIELRHRLFKTGCNPETIRHVIGNFFSCWHRLCQTTIHPPIQSSPLVGANAPTEARSFSKE